MVSDQVLAKSVDGIDLIIGGHTHTLLEKPMTFLSPDGSQVIVNQVGWAGICVGRIDMTLDKKMNKSVALQQAILLDNKV